MSERKALAAALELISELRAYASEAWDWKYGDRWDEETAVIQQALTSSRESMTTKRDRSKARSYSREYQRKLRAKRKAAKHAELPE